MKIYKNPNLIIISLKSADLITLSENDGIGNGVQIDFSDF